RGRMVRLAGDWHQLDMSCFITSQAVDQGNEDALYDRILVGNDLAGVRRLFTPEHPGAGTDRRADGLASKCGRSDFNLGIVANPLQLPSRVESADEGTITVNGNVHRSANR